MIATRNICRYLVGALFIFSGFVKIVDPVGMSIKLEKYFHVFDAHLISLPQLFTIIIPLLCLAAFLLNLTFFMEGHWWKWVLLLLISLGTLISYLTIDSSQLNQGVAFNYSGLSAYSLFFSVLLLVLEISLGIALITLYRIKFTAWALLVLISFFTLLTFFTAITGTPSDCGCFGDFLTLSPWTSFIKDFILLGMILVIFIQRDKFVSKTDNLHGAGFNLLNAIFWVFFANYCINHLPVIDFRPYKVGTDLNKVTSKPIEKKSGFAVLKDGWEVLIYDDVKNLKNEHLSPPNQWICSIPMEKASDNGVYFNVIDAQDKDVTSEILDSQVLLVTANDYELSGDRGSIASLKRMKNTLWKKGIETRVLLSGSSVPNDDEVTDKIAGLSSAYYTIDSDECKKMIRARLGAILLDQGVIKGKWHINDLPDAGEIMNLL